MQPTYVDAVLALAVLLLGRHDSVDGEPLLRRGLELNPNSWVGYRMRLEAAMDAAKTAESLAPQHPKVDRLLPLIHLRQKNYQVALADLDAYIRLDPPRAAPQDRSAPTPSASWKPPIPDLFRQAGDQDPVPVPTVSKRPGREISLHARGSHTNSSAK
jgi:hypothetical protein